MLASLSYLLILFVVLLVVTDGSFSKVVLMYSAEVAKFYGFGNDYKSIWNQLKPINGFSKELRAAVDNKKNVDAVVFKPASRGGANKSSGSELCPGYRSTSFFYCFKHILVAVC